MPAAREAYTAELEATGSEDCAVHAAVRQAVAATQGIELTTLEIEFGDDVTAQLADLARNTGRCRSAIISDALYVRIDLLESGENR